jgi:hypothetical protein
MRSASATGDFSDAMVVRKLIDVPDDLSAPMQQGGKLTIETANAFIDER